MNKSADSKKIIILLSNVKERSPIIECTLGLDPEKANMDQLFTLAETTITRPQHLHTYYLRFDNFWYLFTNGSDSVYVNRCPSVKVLNLIGQDIKKSPSVLPEGLLSISAGRLFHYMKLPGHHYFACA